MLGDADERGIEVEMSSAAPVRRSVRAPTWPVAVALGCAVVATAMAAWSASRGEPASLTLSLTGYVIGSIAVSVLIVVHRVLKQRAQQSTWYEPRRVLNLLARWVLLVGLAAGAVNAFFLATELAKR